VRLAAISLALADAGADVALGLRDVHAQGSLPAQIEAMGRQVIPLQMTWSKVFSPKAGRQ
jgi:hypothetical protein